MITEMAYITYLAVSIGMTIWVAKTLSKSGRIFLLHKFNGDEALAQSVNQLLVLGFYLINLGFVFLTLKTDQNLMSARDAIEFISQQIGFVLFVLGAVHFINLLAMSWWRGKTKLKASDAAVPAMPIDQAG